MDEAINQVVAECQPPLVAAKHNKRCCVAYLNVGKETAVAGANAPERNKARKMHGTVALHGDLPAWVAAEGATAAFDAMGGQLVRRCNEQGVVDYVSLPVTTHEMVKKNRKPYGNIDERWCC